MSKPKMYRGATMRPQAPVALPPMPDWAARFADNAGAPRQDATGAELGAAFVEQTLSQGTPFADQVWGSTQDGLAGVPALPVGDLNSLGWRRVVAIGPFERPRPIDLEYFYDDGTLDQALVDQGSYTTPTGAVPTFVWRATIGIGDSTIQQIWWELPPVVSCMSLFLEVARCDAGGGTAKVTTWGSPSYPRYSPTPLITRLYSMAISTLTVPLQRGPSRATHLMVSQGNAQNQVYLNITMRQPGGLNVVTTRYAAGGMSSGSPPTAAVPAIIPIPRQQAATIALGRISGTAAEDYAVTWLRG